MKLSYWEYKEWFSNVDFTIVGSGIVGLSCARYLKQSYPNSKIIVLEKGILPQGASTKNAGFACFGSISEVLSDLENSSEDEVLQLVGRRWEGIQLLRANLGDQAIGFQADGGHEVFLNQHKESFEKCLEKLTSINELLKPVFKTNAYRVLENKFSFQKVCNSYISNPQEGQIDTGLMMGNLLSQVQNMGVRVLNALSVQEFSEAGEKVLIKTDNLEFYSKKLCIATNGFASELIKEEVLPARAQVLITKPIENLKLYGTFHLEEGYYYFRNIDNRILIGGGRNLNFERETTTEHGHTEDIQNKLEDLLSKVIIPGKDYEVAHRWSGIMGVGNQKKPIVKQLSNSVYCGVRLGGMGIAIGSFVGKELANLVQG
ncbi:MAG: NAD(P)/FAD-dependent oxidoreductase [Flavobacteriaceae bacterium]